MKEYKKLVRDKIPSIIEGKGEVAHSHVADKEEYEKALHQKLEEEVAEFLQDESAEELADIYEVLDAIMTVHSISKDKVLKVQKEKREKRGGFEKRIILDSTD